ncbi:LacI family DNA-binding transcriptional regulator [Homoserinibacter sp. YIM 151385]|uniref:LacI family DNA-binding transcriptional regulator n=1 Tax=Homoserinibacter sp. YIM 151385 TaxID=2985506 RepID=UPI0022F13590|nr:LacI family DNA-binding transcriptional regulator [Homoserinibacter sp. YIM 151385]WBU37192.1 LacI family DNA-binding transcriptional regulator [Homoserinibacter sp. YIM 151385]
MSAGATTRPTLAAVAARAGVSASTASLVFSGAGPVAEATRERVLAAAAELDYAGPDPRAQSLRRGRSGIIGVVLEDSMSDSLRDPMNLALLDGIAAGLDDAGSSLLLLANAGEDAGAVSTAPIDAAVLLGCSASVAVPVELLGRRRIPVVGVETERFPGVAVVDIENRAGSRAAAAHLRSLGHERVAMVTMALEAPRARGALTPEREAAATGRTTIERIRGVREVYPDADGLATFGSTIDEGRRAARELLAAPAGARPTAILAQSDLLAVGVLLEAEELGIAVPAELSIIGFDGVRVDDWTTHRLTTVVQDGREKGRAVGRALAAAARGETAEPVVLPCELRIGTTTGPAPHD